MIETIYKKALFGAEESLNTDLLPSNLSEFDLVHVTPLGDAVRQFHFISSCRERNAKIISGGTGIPLIKNNFEKISTVIQNVDLFFINEEESHLLFPDTKQIKTSTGKVLFVTKGPKGASVYIGDHEIAIESIDTNGLDPTGAGDTFCGATITGIACGEHPLKAALVASALAAEMISGIGPEKLLRKSKPPRIHVDKRVKVNQDQKIEEMNKFWGNLADQVAFVNYVPWENVYESEKLDMSTPCSDLWRRMFVWWNGDTNPCDVDYKSKLIVGNIRDKNLSELWNSKNYTSLRNKHIMKKRKETLPCNRCNVV